MTLERMRLSELERVRRGRVAFLAEASEMLSSTLDQMQAVALAAQLVVPRLAAWCAVYLTPAAGGAGGEPELAYVWHADESQVDALRELLEAIPPPMYGVGWPDLVGLGAAASRSWSLAVGHQIRLSNLALLLARDSAWSFPLTARGRGLGVVVIGRTRGDPRWPDPPSQQAFEMAEDLTRRVALALDNARLYERQRLANQALQRSLLPPELPSIPRVDLAVAYEAAGETNEVGGDFYDVFPVGCPAGGDHWRFAIGDVCGTGPEAAAVTGLARNTLRILAAEGHDIATVVQRLNDLILREGARARFLTLLQGEISVPSEPGSPVRMTLVCAGHPLPLLIPASGAPVRPVAEPQPLLGVMPDASFGIEEVDLEPGDIVVCVTDGVTERRDDRGDLLDDDGGLSGVLAACRGLSAAAVVARVQREVEEFSSTPPHDDMAILAIRAR
jgi:serine phosphatase RsbU (regulator of sigma subunit)